jgi:RNase H-like domain found in reverse transcriptase
MGAVLMQNQQPVAYFSKAMEVKYQSLSTYDKELMALVWWQQFRNGDITSKMKGRFIIKTMRA